LTAPTARLVPVCDCIHGIPNLIRGIIAAWRGHHILLLFAGRISRKGDEFAQRDRDRERGEEIAEGYGGSNRTGLESLWCSIRTEFPRDTAEEMLAEEASQISEVVAMGGEGQGKSPAAED
jgi:hypothetical protein